MSMKFKQRAWRALVLGTCYTVMFVSIGIIVKALAMWMNNRVPQFSIDEDGVHVYFVCWIGLVLLCFWDQSDKRN
jgi:hypothetical protein